MTATCLPPTVAEIDLGAFAHNLQTTRARLAPGCGLMAVLKANAYGHGAVPLARVAAQHGVTSLGVARCQEGIALRQQGIQLPIVVLGPTWPEEVEALLTSQLTPVAGSLADLQSFQATASRRDVVWAVHLKIDTGMGRFGVTPTDVPGVLACLSACTHLRLEGLMTHLACADTSDVASVQQQLARFQAVVRVCAQHALRPRYIHAANSAGVYRYPTSHGTLVRAGIALYGTPTFAAPAVEQLRPVLHWKTRLVRVQAVPAGSGVGYGHTFVTRRASVIGTLPLGYGDGLSRKLSNCGEVLLHGQRVPLVGQICMDMCMVDLTAVPCAQVGDEVVLIGAQGNARMTAAELAMHCDSIPYEVLCAISQRVPRRYLPVEPPVCP